MKSTEQLYEELRAVIDDGHESMTHEDALAHVRALNGVTPPSEGPRTITVCRCGSPRVYRDAAMNVNTGEVSTYDSMSCSDCGYDGRHYREIEVDDNFDVDVDSVEPGEAT